MLVFYPIFYYNCPIILGDYMTTQKIKDTYSDDVRLALLEQSINNINSTLVRFEKRFDQIDEKFDRANSNIRDMRTHFDTKIDSNHKWTLGLISGLYLLLSSAFITILIKFVH